MSARPSVEHRACRRHGLCLAVAPDAFAVGTDGRIRVLRKLDDATLETARQAARLCPAQAIQVRA